MAYELKPLMRQKVLYNSTNATNKIQYQLVIDGGDDAVTMATDLLARGVPATQLMTGSDADAERVSFSFLLLEGDDEALFTRLMPADQTASQAVTSQTVTSQTGAVAP